MNAVWDLAARVAGKPLWRLLSEMTPEQLVTAADLRYLSDALTREEALAMLTELEPTRAARNSRAWAMCWTMPAPRGVRSSALDVGAIGPA
jgi:L-alanine-DL-glutamate epimerase-like enolase superfamily enzyme